MALGILVLGRSGTGKTTSLRNMEKDTLVINVTNKQLPFRNNEHLKVYTTSEYLVIKDVLKKAYDKGIRTAVIDDAGYLMTIKFMSGHRQLKGNASFELYNEIADNFYSLIKYINDELPKDMNVYLIMHEEMNEFGYSKPKTIGKLLDEKVCIEGLFTIVLRSMKTNNKYVFVTNTDGLDVTKTPIDMFKEDSIDNDLNEVDKIIREYYK